MLFEIGNKTIKTKILLLEKQFVEYIKNLVLSYR